MWAEGQNWNFAGEEVTASQNCTVTRLPGGVGKIESEPVKATTISQGDSEGDAGADVEAHQDVVHDQATDGFEVDARPRYSAGDGFRPGHLSRMR